MTTIALLAPMTNAKTVFAARHFDRLATLGTLIDARFEKNAGEVLAKLTDVEYIVSTWGMPTVDTSFLSCMPNLRGIFYAAGSVKGFVSPEMYARGIVVSSAALMNAIPVAEYTVGVILLSNKRFWQMMRHPRRDVNLPDGVPGNYRRVVGIIGASMVGRDVIRLLQPYDFDVLLYDPYVDEAEAIALGVTKVDLPELMTASDIVTLHAPNLPSLRHMLTADLFARMQDGATFINTARGALVDEVALLAEVQSGRIYAVLDVTDPEPPVVDSPLYSLPNVIYTPHIAGSMDQECQRMADFAIDELERFMGSQTLRNSVLQETLALLA